MRLFQDRVAVKPIPNPELRNGIWVPHETTTFVSDGDKAPAITKGEVIAFGPGKLKKDGTRRPLKEIREGDLAVFSDTCGKLLTNGIRIMRDDDIGAVIDKDGTPHARGDCVIVEPLPLEETTESGLRLFLSSDEPWRRGKAVAVGPKSTVQVGQTVVYHYIDGQKFLSDMLDGRLIFREQHLLGVLEDA